MTQMKIHELGHVVLYVTNLQRMKNFYERVLGFQKIGEALGMAAFSSGRTHHELLLIEIGGKPLSTKQIKPGLYHIGFKIGNTEKELKDALKVLEKENVPLVGTGDHTVTKSLYILDPDGNELELYIDTSDDWKNDPKLVLTPTKPLRL